MSADLAPVRLVGAGPGDPDLLTLAAERALVEAREVVADRSLAPLLSETVDPSTVVTLVDDDAVAVDEVAAVLGGGPGVVRLYLGDPWFHPAGDAERAALRAADVAFTVVAGVATELATLAAAGIPAQVRTLAVTTTFVVASGDEPVPSLPTDPAHAVVIRTSDLAATVAAVSARASVDATTDRPVALVGDDGAMTRTGLQDLHAVAAGGPGLLVVGLVAAIDLRSPHGAPRPCEVVR